MEHGDVQTIKDRLSVTEVLEEYIELQHAGRNLKARCPFHNEKTPSFVVSPERQTFYCFGCHKHGDIFTFVQEFEGMTFPEALELLAKKAGVELQKKPVKKKDNTVLEVIETASHFYQKNLRGAEIGKKYLAERGVDQALQDEWDIGYIPDEWRLLKTHLVEKGYDEKVLLKSGLIKQSEKGESYDTFRGRIMFPIKNEYGVPVGFTGRYLGDKDDVAKYLNSPETEHFNKSRLLYGFHLAKGAIRKNDFSILVEGQFDVIAAHAMGYKNTVASSGTALSEYQLELLGRLSKRIVIALDADSAGLKASERVWQMALQKGMDVRVAVMPEGKDPADIYLEDERIWKNGIKNALHIIEYLVRHIRDVHTDTRSLRLAIHNDVMPYVRQLESSIEQSYFIDHIASTCSIDQQVLWKELEQKTNSELPVARDEAHHAAQVREQSPAARSSLQELLTIYQWQQQTAEPVIDTDDLAKRLQAISGDVLSSHGDEVDEQAVYEIEAMYDDPLILQKTVEELLRRFEYTVLIDQKKKISQEIAQLEAGKSDEEKLTTLITKMQDINKRLQDIQL